MFCVVVDVDVVSVVVVAGDALAIGDEVSIGDALSVGDALAAEVSCCADDVIGRSASDPAISALKTM